MWRRPCCSSSWASPWASWPCAGGGLERSPLAGAAISRRLQGLGALVAEGEEADYVLLATESELTQLLGLVECRFEATHDDNRILPIIHRDGSVSWGPNSWETAQWGLPTDGATIPVSSRGAPIGRFVLKAPLAVPYSAEQLAQAVALVDQAGAGLARRPASA